MSFEEQERAMFALLFDAELRKRFRTEGPRALTPFELDERERADFGAVRMDALDLDAEMRVDGILQAMCRAYPLTFSIVSSLPEGTVKLQRLVDLALMNGAAAERVCAFGKRLCKLIRDDAFASDAEHQASLGIAEAELAMATITSGLRQHVGTGKPARQQDKSALDLMNARVKLAPFVCAVLLPRPHAQLKRALCPCPTGELWARLLHAPLPAARRSDALSKHDPRLLVARAEAIHVSRCEATIDLRMAELSDGFVPLFRHVDGSASVAMILAHLKHAGAPERVLSGVHAAFQKLLQESMLELCA